MTPTSPGGDQREAFLDGLVAYVLEHGVGTLSLRPLAAALGTSDRMLLYYFGTREQLLVAVLERVTLQLRHALAAAVPPERIPPVRLLEHLLAAAATQDLRPHLRLYVEISGLTAQGREPFASAARGIADAWLQWTAERLDVPAEQRAATAAGLLAAVDGLLLVTFVVGDDVAQQAGTWLLQALRP